MNTDVLIPVLLFMTLGAGLAVGVWQLIKVRRSQARSGDAPGETRALKGKVDRQQSR
jgi:hypothetical protein